ncbi:hypothetical protein MKW94_005567 [Papaver nudicaule]|uniref:C3H1-type domain-containing protein n=1 Tax=Papaver nudicaule TaxID=74823 RepID=A0AA41VWB2_PAPNU|nr:hypothetical protein [Papaver nudicaule]
MCVRPEPAKPNSSSSSPPTASGETKASTKSMNQSTIETEDSSLLELAANNDLEEFKQLVERDGTAVDQIGLWYGRKKGSKQMVLEHRTPLMVAATYGSIDVLKFILSFTEADVNRSCGPDRSTALHCAASGGSVNADEVVNLLLLSGADASLIDANGCRAADVIVVSSKLPNLKASLETLLANIGSDVSVAGRNLRISTICVGSNPSSPENGSPSSVSDVLGSLAMGVDDLHMSANSEKKEYPVDPSLPDIRNSIYSSDEFRMFSFKIRPCSRAYSHDWTECPFVHPGENARRRDPRKFHYSCVPCPDFRKGACRRGDLCEYAHGVFECWLHPAQYRTRLCKDGTSCSRRVCFFAHISEELRPLYMSSGSVVPSPRSSAAALDMAAAMNLYPASPSSASVMLPSPFASPMSPSGNGISHSSLAWPQPNVPALHLPGSNLQSSRLRSSLNARDIPSEEYSMLQEQHQLLSELSCFSQQQRLSSSSLNIPIRTKTLTPSNLEDLFTAEITRSPRYVEQAASSSVFSPSHKSAVLSQFQQQQSMLSPINTNAFSPKNVDYSMLASYASPGRMSPRSMEPISPGSARLSGFSQREKHQQQQQQQQQQLRSLSARDLGSNSSAVVGSPVKSWTKWGSPNGKLDWGVQGDELGHLRRSNSLEPEHNGVEEHDLSWVHSLVKESPPEIKGKVIPSSPPAPSGECSNSNLQNESVDNTVLGAWLEQMQLDQLIA